jgi:hypothetical protein
VKNPGRIRLHRPCYCLEFVGGVRQPWQSGEIGAVDIPGLHHGSAQDRHASPAQSRDLYRRLNRVVRLCCLLRIEKRIAEAD